MIEIRSSNASQTSYVCLRRLYSSESRYNLIKELKYAIFQYNISIKNTKTVPQLNMKN